jgi:hypothetical protein
LKSSVNFWQLQYMEILCTVKLRNIADHFALFWDLCQYLGFVNSKHIFIKEYSNTGSHNLKYRVFIYVHLIACADADGCFITVCVSDLGRRVTGVCFEHLALLTG